MRVLASLLGLTLSCAMAAGDVLYSRPPTGNGPPIASMYSDPDGLDWDEFTWDSFVLPAGADITEIQWRGSPGGGITNFEFAIYSSIPAGTQPDVGGTGVLWHELVAGNCGETPAGTSGGINWFDYHYTLPTPFHVAGGTTYWLQIIAWKPGTAYWGMAPASGGNGYHFARVPAEAGDFRFINAGGDNAFTLIGTPSACSNPVITQHPQPVTTCYGMAFFSLSVEATGAGPFTYQWRRNGGAVYDGPNGGGMGGGSTHAGATTATLTISNGSYYADVGAYDCVVSNACGPTTSQAAQVAISFSGPTINGQPAPANACVGGSAAFSVTASGAPLSYAWRRDGMPLADGVNAAGSVVVGASSATLQISNLHGTDAGSYTCLVSNGCYTLSTGAALSLGAPPVFTLDPSPATDCLGGTASFGAAATGAVSYQWYKDGVPLGDGPTGSGSTIAGASTGSVTVLNLQASDAGSYACEAVGCGAATSAGADLTVGMPTISQDPYPAAAPLDGLAQFWVVASGSGPVSYQWRFNGVNLSDDAHYNGTLSDTLTVSGCGYVDVGSYDCVVTDACGSIPSAPATLVIYCPADLDDGSGTGSPDSGVDINDLLYFLAAYEAGDLAADLDDGTFSGSPDGGVDINDLLYFLAHYESGC